MVLRVSALFWRHQARAMSGRRPNLDERSTIFLTYPSEQSSLISFVLIYQEEPWKETNPDPIISIQMKPEAIEYY